MQTPNKFITNWTGNIIGHQLKPFYLKQSPNQNLLHKATFKQNERALENNLTQYSILTRIQTLTRNTDFPDVSSANLKAFTV